MSASVENIRMAGLDYLRIGLALLVFAFHARLHLGTNFFFMNPFVEMGAVAMTGFFVLSGYSMAYAYTDRDMVGPSQFYDFMRKRVFAIWPAFVVMSVISMVINSVSIRKTLMLMPIELSGLSTVFTTLFRVRPVGGTWFISCLLFCYASFPLVNYLMSHVARARRLQFLAIVSCLLLYSPVFVGAYKLADIYSNPFFRMLEFWVGVGLWYLIREIKWTPNWGGGLCCPDLLV